MQVQPGGANQPAAPGTTAQQPAAKPDANTAQQPAAKPDANTAQQPAPKPDANTAQQPPAGGAGATSNTNVTVNITPQQKTEVKQIIVTEKVQPIKVNFTIAIGTVVPKTVVLRACPARFVELFPDVWAKEKRCEYFYLDDGRIVFVEPGTLKIVFVVTV
jgi:hypothetical protein